MSSSVKIVLACKPSVRQWLMHQYGNPVVLPRGCSFKNQFVSCLEKSFTPLNAYNRKLLTASVEIQINNKLLFKHGYSIKPGLQYHINDVIEEKIKFEAYEFIEAFMLAGKKVDDAVKSYQKARAFDEEVYSFDAIRRNYFNTKLRLKNIYAASFTK